MNADFELVMPGSLDGALEALAAPGAPPRPLAGGTNLLVEVRAGRERPAALLAVGGLEALRGIEAGTEQVRVGAGTTVSDLLRHPEPAAIGTALLAAAGVFAGQMVRNAATVGGNLCHGSPAADLVPPLLALDAEVELASRAGKRTVALDEFFLDYRETARRPDELLSAIRWPRPAAGAAQRFYKLARRKGDAITVTGVAVALELAEGRCRRVRIALGAVAPTVLRAREAEALLEGEEPSAARIEAAARAAAAAARPIDDVRASARYRRHAVGVLTRRLLTQARDQII